MTRCYEDPAKYSRFVRGIVVAEGGWISRRATWSGQEGGWISRRATWSGQQMSTACKELAGKALRLVSLSLFWEALGYGLNKQPELP